MKISGTIKPEKEKWIKEKITRGKYYDRSHIIQEAIKLLQQKEKNC